MTATELSPRGRGGVSVLAVSGRATLQRLRDLCSPTELPPPGSLRVVRLRSAGELVDEALCLGLVGGAFELHLHGNPTLVDDVIGLLGGAVEASDGDELAAAAWARLADAPSEAAARVLLDQAEGALDRAFHELERMGDPERAEAAAVLLERGKAARYLFHPPRVVLAGSVNAGKSTLFNALVGRERVLVSAEAGTTRDVIEERIPLGPYAVDLFDTAGERSLDGRAGAAEVLERHGQRRARDGSARADLVLWLVPPGADPGAERRAMARHLGAAETPVRVVFSKSDEGGCSGGVAEAPSGSVGAVEVSAARDAAGARARVVELVAEALGLPRTPWTPGRAVPFEVRQIAHLEGICGH